jgi:hypothetical protein
MPTPKLEDLPADSQQKLLSKTKLDQLLYTRIKKHWRKIASKLGRSFRDEVRMFRSLSISVADECARWPEYALCEWYSLSGNEMSDVVNSDTASAYVRSFEL